MAITYKWTISQMQAHIESDGESNVIFRVHYIYVGSEESEGNIYSENFMGMEEYTYLPGEPFVPYEDTEAFENVVIGWLEDSLDVASMQNTIAQNIQSQLTPVDEDLYFTWMIPPMPTE